MLLKIMIILGGLTIGGAMVYDRFTGKHMTRRIVWPLAAGLAAIIIAIVARGFLD